jgi:iron complex outermembrane receptor protein
METKFLKNFTNEVVYRYNERVNNGSYNLLDEKLSFAKKDYSVYVLINNLTNTKYTEALVYKCRKDGSILVFLTILILSKC